MLPQPAQAPYCLFHIPMTLEDHKSTVSIGGRKFPNLRFTDDIDGLAGSELELANLVERLDKTSTAYGMQISTEKNQSDDQQHQWHQQ